MDAKIEKLISHAGGQHRYQILSVVICFFIWTNADLNSIALPFLEKMPEVSYRNPKTGEMANTTLNYTICDAGKETYNITKQYDYSWVSEFDIECDRFKTGLVGSILFAGVMVGSFTFQFFADKFGRKNTTTWFLLSMALYMILETLMKNIIPVMCFFFFGGALQCLIALGSFLLTSESTSVKKRALYGSIIQTGFSACGIFFIFFFRYVGNWRWVFYISAGSNLLCTICFHYLMVESPRFYCIKKDSEKFLQSLRGIAKFNKRSEVFEEELSKPENEFDLVLAYIRGGGKVEGVTEESIIEEYMDYPENEENLEKINEKGEYNNISKNEKSEIQEKLITPSPPETKPKKRGFFDLVKYPSIRYKFLTLCVLWFCISGNYYGLTIHLKSLPGDIYINGILIYSFEACAYFFAGFMVNVKWAGRKKTICFFLVVAVLGFSILLIRTLPDFLIVSFTFICRFGVAGVFNILYSYSLENYPTSVRAQGFGLNSTAARIGSIIFPMLMELLAEYMTLFFVIMNFCCLLLMIFCMPETLGAPMLDKIPEEAGSEIKIESSTT